MASFTDTSGRTWHLLLTIGMHRRLKKDLRVDFTDHSKSGGIMRVASDPELLGSTIWLMIEEQAKTVGVTEDQWVDAVDGEVAAEATDALNEAIVNFSPPHRRDALRRVINRTREMEAASGEEVVDYLESEETEALVRKESRGAMVKMQKQLTR